MKFTTALPLFFAALSAAAPAQEAPADDTPPSGVYVKGVTWNGSGCPKNGVQSQISDDKKVITLLFSEYQAQIGPGAKSRADARKNCQINLKLNYPSGYQYSVVGVITRGYVDIDAGVTGEIVSNYYFSGQSSQTTSRASINGPYHNSYKKEDKLDLQTVVWSPCDTNGMANINTDIRLTSNNPQAGGLLTVDSIDAKFEQKIQYKIQWRKSGNCKVGDNQQQQDDGSDSGF